MLLTRSSRGMYDGGVPRAVSRRWLSPPLWVCSIDQAFTPVRQSDSWPRPWGTCWPTGLGLWGWVDFVSEQSRTQVPGVSLWSHGQQILL